jgi:hypothetical protein
MTKKYFNQLFNNLGYIMPCVFCRESYKQFYKELPIDDFLSGRVELMYWLYLMKDKVNNKLIAQEKKCYNDEKKKLKCKYKEHKISKDEYYSLVKKFKKNTFKTIPTPPFKDVLDKYEKLRAICHAKTKSCSIKKK